MGIVKQERDAITAFLQVKYEFLSILY